jgi:hypothetical protein
MILAAPLLALTRCLFPSLDGLAGGDASLQDAGFESGADVATLGTYAEEVKADSPAAWWRLGENDTSLPAKDQMGFQDGTYHVPGVTLGLKGAITSDPDTAVALDGVNGSMFLPGTLFGFGGSPSFAIEVWISPGAAPPADASDPLRRIVSHRTSAPYFGWFLAIDATQRVFFTRWDSNATVASITSSPIAQGQFTHVVASADGSNLVLFVNGAQVASGPEATITDTPAAHVAFGSTSDFTTEWLDGTLDEPAIYTHALAPARVVAHYQAGIAK